MRFVERRKQRLATQVFVVSVVSFLFGRTGCVSLLNPFRYQERDYDDAGNDTEQGKGSRSQNVQDKPDGGPAAGQNPGTPIVRVWYPSLNTLLVRRRGHVARGNAGSIAQNMPPQAWCSPRARSRFCTRSLPLHRYD